MSEPPFSLSLAGPVDVLSTDFSVLPYKVVQRFR